MKLCPQCEFIYEDDQTFCDMDGKVLVYDPRPLAFAGNVPAGVAQLSHAHTPDAATRSAEFANLEFNPTLDLPPDALVSAPLVATKHTSKWSSQSLALALLAGLILLVLLFVVYYARPHLSRARNSSRSASQSASGPAGSQTQPQLPSSLQAAELEPVDSGAGNSVAETASSEQSSGQTVEPPAEQVTSANSSSGSDSSQSTESSSSLPLASGKSLPRLRPGSNPVSARASAETNRAQVIIRLNNGASLKADEAWEKKEGVWYRQAGMVTFLKRGRVRSIQRVAPANRNQTQPSAGTSIAQNQPGVGKPVVVNTRKDSKITSFLKKTGRILKRPFKS
jgi:hypothetical protein